MVKTRLAERITRIRVPLVLPLLLLLLATVLVACGAHVSQAPTLESSPIRAGSQTPVATATPEASRSPSASTITTAPCGARTPTVTPNPTAVASLTQPPSGPNEWILERLKPDVPPVSTVPVPEYPGARIITLSEDHWHVKKMYRTDDDPQQVLDFYRSQLPKLGWTEEVKRREAGRLVYRLVLPGAPFPYHFTTVELNVCTDSQETVLDLYVEHGVQLY